MVEQSNTMASSRNPSRRPYGITNAHIEGGLQPAIWGRRPVSGLQLSQDD